MLGIPFIIQRESKTDGIARLERETIYLRSRRRGEAGEKMRKAIREYNKQNLAFGRLATKAAVAIGKLENADVQPTQQQLEDIEQNQSANYEAAQNARIAALAAAETVAEQALVDNYGEGVKDILDRLTDRELDAIVGSVEMGAMPKDFFTHLDTQQKQSTTLQSGASPAVDLLQPVSAGQILSQRT
jgi:hypothetical protein